MLANLQMASKSILIDASGRVKPPGDDVGVSEQTLEKRTVTPAPELASRPISRRRRSPWLLGGGIDGNEQLTAMTGILLLILLAALGVTILRIGQLIWLHLFLGLLLIGPVVLKIASTSYRFLRYYTRNVVYIAKGPPAVLLRTIGPLVVLTTVGVFLTGVLLLFNGPVNRSSLLFLHKATFVLWLVFMALHVLGHLPGLGRAAQAMRLGGDSTGPKVSAASGGAAGRWLAIASAIVGGLVLAVVLIPHFGAWTGHLALWRHHDH